MLLWTLLSLLLNTRYMHTTMQVETLSNICYAGWHKHLGLKDLG